MADETQRANDVWQRVDALIDRAPSADDIRAHRVEVLAARRFRSLGRAVPADFVAEERRAALVSMSVTVALRHFRDAYDGPAVLLKGPEVAARYPDPALRAYGDIDLLVPDARTTHEALVAAGFAPVGDPSLYEDIHHLRPLLADGSLLPIEVHSRPKWLDSFAPPPSSELFATAVPSTIGLDGFRALAPEEHAVVLAVHSWAHEPLRRLRDIVDVAAVLEGADRERARALARRWRVERLWRSTVAVVDELLGDGGRAWSLRVWAQNLARVRERTVFESHTERWLSDFWGLPARAAITRVPRRLGDELRRDAGESWGDKLARTTLAVRNAPRRRSSHHQDLDERASRSRTDQPNG